MIRRSTEGRVDSSTVSTEVVPQQGTTEETGVRPDPSTGDGDHERFAHYVLKDKIVDSGGEMNVTCDNCHMRYSRE